jgi:hypothetical protein
MSATVYPVHVEAQLDPRLSRWQWLVKWLLALPHYLVLAFLWLAFVVLSFAAFFAILFTGRYPRAIFDFNVGVLRWSWRVAYYAYGALATDQYPPFSLKEVPDYPAHLEVDYPEHLSRGLVLVKWWLLAIPHYLVLALFLGGVGYAADGTPESDPTVWGTGLIGLLVFVAAVVLLFTGRYPRPLYDFVLGLNRWVIRVAAYAALMTDAYPPFRLDQGGHEPDAAPAAGPTTLPAASPTASPAAAAVAASGATGATSAASGSVAQVPPPTGARHDWTAGRLVALVLGCLVMLGSLGVGLAGGALALADTTLRDDGYLMSGEETFATDTYAVVSESMEIHAEGPAAFMPDNLLGRAKITASSEDTPVFLGIAPTSDVEAYLAGVQRATVVDLEDQPVYELTGTEAPAAPPGDQTFWVAQASGTGTQAVTFDVENGDWTVVLMNADGSAGVSAEMTAGATVPALGWVVAAMLVIAGLGLLLAIVLMVVALREPAEPGPREAQPTPSG